MFIYFFILFSFFGFTLIKKVKHFSYQSTYICCSISIVINIDNIKSTKIENVIFSLSVSFLRLMCQLKYRIKHILNFSLRGNKYLTKMFFQMQYLNTKGNNVADADVVAISSSISKIEKLSGIEKIRLAFNSKVKIPLLVEIIKKMDEPVIMETNYDYLLFLLINNYFYYSSLHFFE